MGKKARLKNRANKRARMPFVARTFHDLPNEVDWIAMREFIPAATATATLSDGTSVVVCSLLPGGGAGLVRTDGSIWIGLQVLHNYGDVSRDLAHTIELAQRTEPGKPVVMTDPGVGPRLQDLLDISTPLEVTVHEGFDYWLDGVDADENTGALLEQANESAAPTLHIEDATGAYWTEMGDKRFVRWVRTEKDDALLDALARLHVAGDDRLTDAGELIGHFRAHGLLVPVWEVESDAAELAQPASEFAERLQAALDSDEPLSTAERSARQSLVSRQVAIR